MQRNKRLVRAGFILLLFTVLFSRRAECLGIFKFDSEQAMATYEFTLSPTIMKELDWLENQLQDAKMLWQINSPFRYTLSVEVDCLSPFKGNNYIKVDRDRITRINGDSEAAGQFNSGNKELLGEYTNFLVPALFDKIENAIQKARQQVLKWQAADPTYKSNVILDEPIYKTISVNYDKKFGYPHYIETTFFAEDANILLNIEISPE